LTGLQADCFLSHIYDSPSISTCHAPLQGVCRRPPPLPHPGVFSSVVCTMESGVHVQVSAPHSPTRVDSVISSSSWLAVPESFRGCSDGGQSSGVGS